MTFLWPGVGSPAPKSGTNPFTDVQSSAYYYEAVLRAAKNSVTMGTSANIFNPDNACTRGQIVTFLCRIPASVPDKDRRGLFVCPHIKSSTRYNKAILTKEEVL